MKTSNNPVQTKILEFIDSIKNKDILQLASANCGIFAKLLKKMFGEGEFIAIIGDLEPEMVYHVMLRINDKYYDSRGEWEKEEIIRTYQKINRLCILMGEQSAIEKYEIFKIDEEDIEKLTEPNMTIEELVAKIQF